MTGRIVDEVVIWSRWRYRMYSHEWRSVGSLCSCSYALGVTKFVLVLRHYIWKYVIGHVIVFFIIII